MSEAQVTVIMAPRERYTRIAGAIESLYEHTDQPIELFVIDGALPDDVRKEVEALANKHGFHFDHKPYPLTPNEARNIALAQTKTPWIVFADNDVVFTPNWLPPLIKAAEDYDAWLVGPTILDGDTLEDGMVHAAGGDSGFEMVNGKPRYHFVPGHMHVPYEEAKPNLKRGPTTMVEFHVMFARASIFDTIGPLDEKLLSFADHDDLVVSTLKHGGPVIYEPASAIVYPDPGTDASRLEESDLPYFLLRWSDDWNCRSIDHFAEKWGLDPEDNWMPHTKHWIRVRRRGVYPVAGFFGKLTSFTLFNVNESIGAILEKSFLDKYTGRLKKLRNQHCA